MWTGKRIVWEVVFLLSLALALAACGGIADYVPQPVVLPDTTPAQLDAFLAVTMGGYDAATRDMTQLHVGFAAGGRPVQFIADERVVCNGVTLQRFVGSFDAMVPTTTVAGKLLSCTYTSGHSSATFTLTVPAAPAILAPRNHAQVPREAQTVVQYRLPAGTVSGVVALAPAGKATADQGAAGNSQTLLDTRLLSPGSGSVALAMDLTLPNMPNPGFKSLRVRGEAMTMVAVTWV